MVHSGQVKIAAQSDRQAALAQKQFNLPVPPPVVGLRIGMRFSADPSAKTWSGRASLNGMWFIMVTSLTPKAHCGRLSWQPSARN
jgi:hypothetical protein